MRSPIVKDETEVRVKTKYDMYKLLWEMQYTSFVKNGLLSRQDRGARALPIMAMQLSYLSRVRGPSSDAMFVSRVLFEEMCFRDSGNVVYFPENSELLHMLWNSNMKDVEPPVQGSLPLSFVVAFPKDLEIHGIPIPSALVVCDTDRNVAQAVHRQAQFAGIATPAVDFPPDEGTRRRISITMSVAKVGRLHHELYAEDMQEALTSVGDLARVVQKRASPGPALPDEKLSDLQYIVTRLVLRLMIYITALPDMVKQGFPESVHSCEMGLGIERSWKPVRLHMPEVSRDSHGRPTAHWRTWHFRRYPERKDGTRTPGTVFVNACVVNADITPKTVLEADDKQTQEVFNEGERAV